MNPFTLMMGATQVAGLGMQLFGAKKQSGASQEIAAASQEEAHLEQQVNAQRKQQMVLTSQRQQMQNIRNSQLARSMALTSSTAQGSQFGSGLQGGLGQIAGQENTNALATNQNLEIGQNIFGLDDKISEQKMRIAAAGGQAAAGEGMASMGRSIFGAAAPIGRTLGNFKWGGSGGGHDPEA